MKALLIYVPSRSGFGADCIPLGPMAISNTFMESGYEVKFKDMIFDGNASDMVDFISSYKPDIVGYSGIASSYPKAKELSHAIRASRKDIVHLAGGPLASTYDLLLKNKVADYVVHGEAEVSLPKLLRFIKEGAGLEKVGGVSYIKDGKVFRSSPEEQIKDLDTIKLPVYDLVDMNLYIQSLTYFKEVYGYSLASNQAALEKIDYFIGKGKEKFIGMVTSRGCTHACLFCYRHVRGIRRNSVNYVIEHIKFLMDKYGVGGIQISDELFNNDPDWVYQYCDAVESAFKGEFFYHIVGARANAVDMPMLKRLRETGCVSINYGQESGSAKILKEYRKGVTVEENIRATNMSKEAGLFTPVQLVIGSPSESTGTILETVDFLKKVNGFYKSTSINYFIPMPETPIWKTVTEKGLIPDVEDYLARVARYGGMFDLGLNLTKSSNFVWKSWLALLMRRTLLNEALHKKNYLRYAFDFCFGSIAVIYLSKRIKRLFGIK